MSNSTFAILVWWGLWFSIYLQWAHANRHLEKNTTLDKVLTISLMSVMAGFIPLFAVPYGIIKAVIDYRKTK